MKRLILFYSLLFLVFNVPIQAQQTAVSGQVTASDDGTPLPGVNILIQGTTTGTTSDLDGNYKLNIPAGGATLVFSFVGYENLVVETGGRSAISVQLVADVSQLEEVVVTAFGIERQQKALGYSVTEVKGQSISEARENNVVNSLAGRVAGVVVSSPATGPAASSRVVIRGNSSITGNNQPLYVVDGVPLDNSNLDAAGMWGGKDLGDGISSLNPDDIESMSVLKGPTASALYGSRAQNGVILITTKKGRAGEGIGVEINSNFLFENPLINEYEEFQYEYGAGTGGLAPADQDEAISFNRGSSWGAPIAGQSVIQYDGVSRPYAAQRDNITDFYETGRTLTNTVALTGGTENATFRFSGSYLDNKGLVPESGLERYTFNLRGSAKLGERLSTDVKINYIQETADNRPSLSDTPENPGLVIPELASTTSIRTLRNYEDENGAEIPWNGSIFRTNPYWGVFEQTNLDTKNRLLGFALLRYEFTDWLSLQVRTGTDQYTLRQTDIDGFGTSYVPEGRITERNWDVKERNHDVLLQVDRAINEDFRVSASFGANHRTQRSEIMRISGNNFFTADFQDITNTKSQSTESRIASQKEVNSLYGAVQVGYKNVLFLDLTARNDWSSTLTNPLDPDGSDNSFFYPSASLSFAFTDAFDIGWAPLTFGKIRVAAARVGNDSEDPYVQLLTYSLSQPPFNGQGLGQIGTDRIPNSLLVPEENNAIEVGADLRFLNNRLGVDFAWYRQRANELIIPVNVSQSSGFNSSVVNAGELENKGVELLLTGTPVQTASGFQWDVAFNFSSNDNEVLTLRDPVERLTIGTARSFVTVEARIGEPYGTIVGAPYRRTFEGEIIYDTDGTPLFGEIEYNANGTPALDADGNVIINERKTLGVASPDWSGGISNTFTYKGFTLSTLIDIRSGGEIYSQTNAIAYSNGNHINTLEGREAFYAGTGGVVGQGVVNNGTLESPEFAPNTTVVDPETYFGSLPDEEFVYDAGFIKMRQIVLGYTLPSSLIKNTPFQAVKVSLVGRNLFFIHKDVDNIDPESTYSSRNDAQGFEYGTLPTTKSYGFNINIKL